MKKAKRRALVWLALLVLGSFAIAALPGFAYAQTVIADDGKPGNPDASGDPDMPGEKPPAPSGPVSWDAASDGLYAGSSIDPTGRPAISASRRADARRFGRLWLESLVWVVRTRFGW
jgi:hypothetical protein